MRFGWLINNFADPGLALTPAQRALAFRSVNRRLRAKLYLFTFLIVTPPPIAAIWATGFIDDWTASVLGISKNAASFALMALICFATWPWSAWLYGRFYTRPYRAALRDLGIRICIRCGYSLEGLPARATCPECGAPEPPLPPAPVPPPPAA